MINIYWNYLIYMSLECVHLKPFHVLLIYGLYKRSISYSGKSFFTYSYLHTWFVDGNICSKVSYLFFCNFGYALFIIYYSAIKKKIENYTQDFWNKSIQKVLNVYTSLEVYLLYTGWIWTHGKTLRRNRINLDKLKIPWFWRDWCVQ